MNGRLATLVGGVLFVSTLMLGGCVAQVDDGSGFDEASEALVEESGRIAASEASAAAGAEDSTGALAPLGIFDGESDPQPQPWVPGQSSRGDPRPGPNPGPYPGPTQQR